MKKTISLLMLVIITATFLGPSTAFAATWSQQDKGTASDGSGDDYFGRAVDISGNYAVVGAEGADEGGTDRGAAYIFMRTGTNWSQVAKLTPSDPGNDANFGSSVSISGDFVVVGAKGASSAQGAIYLYEKPGGGWSNMTQTAKLTASNAENNDSLGGSVSISGDFVVGGAQLTDNGGASTTGSAYIYKKPGEGWSNMTETKELTAGDAELGDHFGHAVDIDGDYIIVGAESEDGTGSDRGAAYIFYKDQGGGENWGQQKKIAQSGATDGDDFGDSVSISGHYVIVGSDDNDNGNHAGAAYIFYKDQPTTDNWGEQAKLTPSDAGANHYFGKRVAISGDTGLVGAYGDTSNTGAAYIFEKGAGWSNSNEDQKLTASDAASSDRFGISVSMSGYYSIIGADMDDDKGDESGSVYFFSSSDAVVPEFKDYIYILTILIAVGLMSKITPNIMQKNKF